ncbi:MAG: M56 family metallopeptidase [Planctomycetaceae bacterium]|nr:M56 family metallopeptidase [Planctomycetaceae bacterium]
MSFLQFFELILSLSLQVTLLVWITSVVSKQSQSAELQCQLWTICNLLMLCLTVAGLNLPHLRLLHPWGHVPAGLIVHFSAALSRAGMLTFGVWIAGVVVSLMTLMWGTYSTNRFVAKCPPVHGPLQELAAELALSGVHDELGRCGPVSLLYSPEIATPFCWQFHRPHIVLPEFMLDSSEEDIRMVVRHEVEHLRLGHPLQLFVQRIVESLYWFHPAVWHVSRHVNLAREFLCDDATNSTATETVRYLNLLIHIVEQAKRLRTVPPESITLGRPESAIGKRIRRLIARSESGNWNPTVTPHRSVASVVAAAAFVSVCWIPVNVFASPRSMWSPWPRWTADALHDFGIHVRDYETHARGTNAYELLELDQRGSSLNQESLP